MGGSLREAGHPFLCAHNPGRSGWREGWGQGKRYLEWQFTDSKINDPTHKGLEQRSLLIRHSGPPLPPGHNPYKSKSCRFQWPINERPWQTTLSLTPLSPPALHLDNLIPYHRQKEEKRPVRDCEGQLSMVMCWFLDGWVEWNVWVTLCVYVRWRRAIYEQSRGKWVGWRPLQRCCSYGNEK